MLEDRSALFMDRDGTLIVDYGYLRDPEKVELLPGVKEVLTLLHQKHWMFFLLSNQSGVNRGFFTMKEVEVVNQRMVDLIGLGNNFFTEIRCAVGTPEAPCPYRKPSPKFILECLEKYRLNPKKCWMIGDRITDVESGHNANINSILLTQEKLGTCTCPCCANFMEAYKVMTEQ